MEDHYATNRRDGLLRCYCCLTVWLYDRRPWLHRKRIHYAVSQGVPALGFIIDDSASWPVNQNEQDEEKRQKLQAFKGKVRQKPVDIWSSKDDLHAKCTIALMTSFNTTPRPGWIRAPEVTGAESSPRDEIRFVSATRAGAR